MGQSTPSAYGKALREFDPTGEVNLQNPAAVETAIRAILDARYGGHYDPALLASGFADLLRAYRGEYPGLLRCDGLHHDLRHAMETGLTMARMLDGYAKFGAASGVETIDGGLALLGVLLALFHDVGLLRRADETHLWGPVLTPIHEERGVQFMSAYLANTGLKHLASHAQLIMATKLIFRMPADWTPLERRLGSMLASADLLSQLSDRCYLEKCRDFLFLEFTAFGFAGRPDSPYPDAETLLAKTPQFIQDVVFDRLDNEFQGVHRLLAVHCGGRHPWEEAIRRNLDFLSDMLNEGDFSRLRRHPLPYVGATQRAPNLEA